MRGFSSLKSQQIENLSAVQETQEMQVQSMGREDPLEKEMATHSSILAQENPLGRGVWRATGQWVAKSDTIEPLSMYVS